MPAVGEASNGQLQDTLKPYEVGTHKNKETTRQETWGKGHAQRGNLPDC